MKIIKNKKQLPKKTDIINLLPKVVLILNPVNNRILIYFLVEAYYSTYLFDKGKFKVSYPVDRTTWKPRKEPHKRSIYDVVSVIEEEMTKYTRITYLFETYKEFESYLKEKDLLDLWVIGQLHETKIAWAKIPE